MATDFFDEDLAETAATPAPSTPATPENPGESYYERRKREMPEQLTKTGDEIERLKQRQEALERRKQEIIEQRRRVELFEHNRKDLLDKLRRNAVMVVRESEQASRTAALCTEVGNLFSRLHRELEAFAPDSWTEEEYDARLTEALAKVDAASAEYRKAMDQVAAVNWRGADAVRDESDSAFEPSGGGAPRGFGRWFLAGLAFSIPFAILAAIIIAVVFVLRGTAG